jgi:hypothetical protein
MVEQMKDRIDSLVREFARLDSKYGRDWTEWRATTSRRYRKHKRLLAQQKVFTIAAATLHASAPTDVRKLNEWWK